MECIIAIATSHIEMYIYVPVAIKSSECLHIVTIIAY